MYRLKTSDNGSCAFQAKCSQVEGVAPHPHNSIGCFVFVGEQFPNIAVGVAAAIVEVAIQVPGSEAVLSSVEPK